MSHSAPTPTRLRAMLADLEISRSADDVLAGGRRWVWPAVQMGVAASLAWLIAQQVAGDAAGYAPITAIAAIGLGRERRLGRSAIVVSGLLLGVVAAEIATSIIGTGWWQIGLLMAVAAVVTGALIGHELAVTYAAINAVVLLTTPGSDGWVPSRLIAGLTGVAAAIAVMLLLLPPRPVHLVTRRLHRSASRASDALEATARVLREGAQADDAAGDERPLLSLARRLDDEIEQSHATVDQACEIVRWSPWRRRRAGEIDRLAHVAHDLRPALRTASTIARLGDRAALEAVTAPDPLVAGVRRTAPAVRSFTDCLLTESRSDVADAERFVAETIDQVSSAPGEHAIVIALQEEVRGLLDDLATVTVDHVDGVGEPVAREPAGDLGLDASGRASRVTASGQPSGRS